MRTARASDGLHLPRARWRAEIPCVTATLEITAAFAGSLFGAWELCQQWRRVARQACKDQAAVS